MSDLGSLFFLAVAVILWNDEAATTHAVQGSKRHKKAKKRVSGLWPDDPKAMQDADAPAFAAEGDDDPGDLFPPAGFDYSQDRYTYGQECGYRDPRVAEHVDGSGERSQTFGPYTDATTRAFLDKVRSYGMTVSGQNPWHIDARQHGITLDATQDADGHVTVNVATKNIYVSNAKIWDKLAPLMPKADK